MKYRSLGKEVLRGDQHIADAVDTTYAEIIADALNARMTLTGKAKPVRHRIERQVDEYACSCGARWDVREGDDHP